MAECTGPVKEKFLTGEARKETLEQPLHQASQFPDAEHLWQGQREAAQKGRRVSSLGCGGQEGDSRLLIRCDENLSSPKTNKTKNRLLFLHNLIVTELNNISYVGLVSS